MLLIDVQYDMPLEYVEYEIRFDSNIRVIKITPNEVSTGLVLLLGLKEPTAFLCCRYARFSIGKRFKDGEYIIARDAEYAVYYTQYVLKERFLLAEPIIAESGYAQLYIDRNRMTIERWSKRQKEKYIIATKLH